MTDLTPLQNRLKKRDKHLRKWARRWPTQAYRIYDRDIPEFPWTVDRYDQCIYAQFFASSDTQPPTLASFEASFKEILSASEVIFKVRRRQSGTAQYEKQDEQETLRPIEEDGLTFLVNLYDYIDTGLFLDHRAMRRIVSKDIESRDQPTRMLNLFAYTCTFSVYAARAGAKTCSVDLSNTYLNWGKDNFRANGLSLKGHTFERDDILAWLPQAKKDRRRFDVIVLDPPTFSNSKSMTETLDIQRDHRALILQCLELLAPGGSLYFSTNYQRFRLDETLPGTWEEITHRTISEDFRTPIHRAWVVHL